MALHDKRFDLDKMKIASPCSMSWNQMKGDDRTRHCSSCNLNVYNIAGLTNQEAQELLLKRAAGERVCVRMLRRHDGTVVTKDCPVGVSLARRARLKFASLAASALTMVVWFASLKSQAQEVDQPTLSEASATIMPIMGKVAHPSDYTEIAGGIAAPEEGELMGEVAPEGYDEPQSQPEPVENPEGNDDYPY